MTNTTYRCGTCGQANGHHSQGCPLAPTEQDLSSYIQEHTLRLTASRRGGGIEIDAADYLGVEGALVSAYQNYLGGGMLGAIQSSAKAEALQAAPADLAMLRDALMKYFYALTEPEAEDWDDWSAASYDAIQARPASAY